MQTFIFADDAKCNYYTSCHHMPFNESAIDPILSWSHCWILTSNVSMRSIVNFGSSYNCDSCQYNLSMLDFNVSSLDLGVVLNDITLGDY